MRGPWLITQLGCLGRDRLAATGLTPSLCRILARTPAPGLCMFAPWGRTVGCASPERLSTWQSVKLELPTPPAAPLQPAAFLSHASGNPPKRQALQPAESGSAGPCTQQVEGPHAEADGTATQGAHSLPQAGGCGGLLSRRWPPLAAQLAPQGTACVPGPSQARLPHLRGSSSHCPHA